MPRGPKGVTTTICSYDTIRSHKSHSDIEWEKKLFNMTFFIFSFLRLKADESTPKHKRQLTT